MWEFFAFEHAQRKAILWRIKGHLHSVHEDVSTPVLSAFTDAELIDLFSP